MLITVEYEEMYIVDGDIRPFRLEFDNQCAATGGDCKFTIGRTICDSGQENGNQGTEYWIFIRCLLAIVRC